MRKNNSFEKNFLLLALLLLFIPHFSLAGGISVVINEFLPNPAGSDAENEWIELKNLNDSAVDLTGWRICDASDRCFNLSGHHIPAGEFLLLPRRENKISINNNGEELSLWAPNSQLAFKINYSGSAKEDYSFSRFASGDWRWTAVVTPGQENYFGDSVLSEAGRMNSVEKDNDVLGQGAENAKESSDNISKNDMVADLSDGGRVEEKTAGWPAVLGIFLGLVFGGLGVWLVDRFLKKEKL